MRTEVVTAEEKYTLSQARRIIARENEMRRETLKRKIQQKLAGLFMIAVSAGEFACGYAGIIDEGGASLFLIPMGLYLIFTKEV